MREDEQWNTETNGIASEITSSQKGIVFTKED